MSSSCDRGLDPRGLLTGLSDPKSGSYTAGYDTDGRLVTQSMPGGVVRSSVFDPAGEETARSYVADPAGANLVLLAETVAPNVHGQLVVTARASLGGSTSQVYGYDGVGRLAGVRDLVGDVCTARGYRFDAHSNRLLVASTSVAAPGDPCPAVPAQSGYDSADRVIDPGYGYDGFGRTLTLPAAVTGGASLTAGYYVNDLAAAQTLLADAGLPTQTSTTQTWALDPEGRFASTTVAVRDAAGGVVGTDLTRINHYDDTADSPAMIEEGAGNNLTVMFTGPAGDLAMLTNATGNRRLQLVDLHGDVSVQIPLDNTYAFAITTGSPVREYDADEYGVPRPVATEVPDGAGGWDITPETVRPQPRYGWLGGKQRPADTPAGLILMGVRLYHPATGRFLSVDPIPGGNDNPYTYPTDPINMVDLDGRWGCSWCKKGSVRSTV